MTMANFIFKFFRFSLRIFAYNRVGKTLKWTKTVESNKNIIILKNRMDKDRIS